MLKKLSNHSRWILKVHGSSGNPTISHPRTVTLNPTAIAQKEIVLWAVQVLPYSLSVTTPYLKVKEPRCLVLRVISTAQGLESHPYGMKAIYHFRYCFANMLSSLQAMHFFILGVNTEVLKALMRIKKHQ
jgi:hypothetical protein